MIWNIDNSQIYILGTIHAKKEHNNNHLNSINEIYNKVTTLVFETSLDIKQSPLNFYENDKLSNNISKSLFRDLKKEWQKYKLQYANLEKSKIWHAAISLNFSILNKNGYFPENGVDKILWDKSHRDNKRIELLESQSAGLSCFDSAPLEEQRNILTKVVRNKKKVIEQMVDITEGWNACDEERLSCILQECFDESPIMFRNLIIERNTLWLNKFISAFDSGVPTLFVIGVLHCVDTCSIQNMLLEKHNYNSTIINTAI